MAPRITDQIEVLPTPIPPVSRFSLDPTLRRRGALDGGWWPRSRDASAELPSLVSWLNERLGVVLRLGIDARDWDEIPRQIVVGGHPVRVGRFANVNHKIIVTRGPQDHILLLVIPPQASTAAAKSALALAATGKDSGRPEEVLAASGVTNETDETDTNTHKATPDVSTPSPDRQVPSTATTHVRPVVIQAAVGDERDDIGRWLDDGAPSPDFPARQAS